MCHAYLMYTLYTSHTLYTSYTVPYIPCIPYIPTSYVHHMYIIFNICPSLCESPALRRTCLGQLGARKARRKLHNMCKVLKTLKENQQKPNI